MSRINYCKCIVTAIFALAPTVPALSDTIHTSKIVAEIQPPQAGHDCIYFRLLGVVQADPVLPNNPYLALPRTHVGFKEIYALLLAAYMNSTTVSVQPVWQLAASVVGMPARPGLSHRNVRDSSHGIAT